MNPNDVLLEDRILSPGRFAARIGLRIGCCRSLVLASLFLLVGWVFPWGCAAFTQEEENTISVYERVAPCVVNITTAECDTEFFFCSVPTTGSASGIVLKEDGTIVTGYHVVANARNIQVTFSGDGRRLKAHVLGTAPEDDLAVIKVEVADRPLQAIPLGDSSLLKIGEKVLAIGNPFGLGQTLTTGTVSMLGREINKEGKVLHKLIQTDASINPGNSGGALVNSSGELIGMNTLILSPTGSSIGIGFAVPVDRIKEVTPGMLSFWHQGLTWILAGVLALSGFLLLYRLLLQRGARLRAPRGTDEGEGRIP